MGHPFQVIKIGYPKYDEKMQVIGNNPDFRCVSATCNQVTWSDESWLGGNVPDILTDGTPLKDTVTVPVGGYVVVRMIINNPGKGNQIFTPQKRNFVITMGINRLSGPGPVDKFGFSG